MEYTTKSSKPPVAAKKNMSCACGYVDILFWSSGEIVRFLVPAAHTEECDGEVIAVS